MRRLFVALTSAMSVVAFTHMASAADLYQPVYKAAPPPPAPIYNWTGFYLGAHAGWGWASNETATQGLAGAPGVATSPLSFNMDNDSPIAGLQAGYNYQFSSWVLGIEGDISGARLSTSQTGVPFALVGLPACVVGLPCGSATVTEDIRWLASARGRVGYAWGPSLLYVTGGAAWTDVKYTGSTTAVAALGIFPASFSTTFSGPVVGGGYEWMMTPNWTLRAEFLHYWFDKAQTAAFTSPPLTATYTWSRFDVNVARLGLNYKF
jgi:outer membrane immunogenic protein